MSSVSVNRYHDMIQEGTLASDDRVELLDGVIVPRAVRNPPHSFVTRAIREAVAPLLIGWHDRSQEPITLSASEPLILRSYGGIHGTTSRGIRGQPISRSSSKCAIRRNIVTRSPQKRESTRGRRFLSTGSPISITGVSRFTAGLTARETTAAWR